MLAGLFSLAGTSPPARNRSIKLASDIFDPDARRQRRKRAVLVIGFKEIVRFHYFFLLTILFYIIAKLKF